MFDIKAYKKVYWKQYKLDNYERINKRNREQAKDKYLNNKNVVYDHYGRKCACCGETEILFLTLDHKNGHNQNYKYRHFTRGQHDKYKLIIDRGFPKDIQIMCWNCNCGRATNDGVCPHKEKGL